MNKIIKATVLASALFPFTAMAIVDIESLRLDESIQGFSGSMTASASGKSGNTESTNYDVATGVQWVEASQVNLAILSGEYGETDKVETTKEYFAHLRHTNKIDASWAWEVFGQYESKPLNNDYVRTLLGLGGRYGYGHDRYQGTAGFGAMHENQTVEVNGQEASDSLVRLNFYAKGNYDFNSKSKMGIGLYIQPEAEDFENTTSIANLAYTNEINDRLSTTFDFAFQHVSQPAEGLKKTDTQYKFGINYRFGEK